MSGNRKSDPKKRKSSSQDDANGDLSAGAASGSSKAIRTDSRRVPVPPPIAVAAASTVNSTSITADQKAELDTRIQGITKILNSYDPNRSLYVIAVADTLYKDNLLDNVTKIAAIKQFLDEISDELKSSEVKKYDLRKRQPSDSKNSAAATAPTYDAFLDDESTYSVSDDALEVVPLEAVFTNRHKESAPIAALNGILAKSENDVKDYIAMGIAALQASEDKRPKGTLSDAPKFLQQSVKKVKDIAKVASVGIKAAWNIDNESDSLDFNLEGKPNLAEITGRNKGSQERHVSPIAYVEHAFADNLMPSDNFDIIRKKTLSIIEAMHSISVYGFGKSKLDDTIQILFDHNKITPAYRQPLKSNDDLGKLIKVMFKLYNQNVLLAVTNASAGAKSDSEGADVKKTIKLLSTAEDKVASKNRMFIYNESKDTVVAEKSVRLLHAGVSQNVINKQKLAINKDELGLTGEELAKISKSIFADFDYKLNNKKPPNFVADVGKLKGDSILFTLVARHLSIVFLLCPALQEVHQKDIQDAFIKEVAKNHGFSADTARLGKLDKYVTQELSKIGQYYREIDYLHEEFEMMKDEFSNNVDNFSDEMADDGNINALSDNKDDYTQKKRDNYVYDFVTLEIFYELYDSQRNKDKMRLMIGGMDNLNKLFNPISHYAGAVAAPNAAAESSSSKPVNIDDESIKKQLKIYNAMCASASHIESIQDEKRIIDRIMYNIVTNDVYLTAEITKKDRMCALSRYLGEVTEFLAILIAKENASGKLASAEGTALAKRRDGQAAPGHSEDKFSKKLTDVSSPVAFAAAAPAAAGAAAAGGAGAESASAKAMILSQKNRLETAIKISTQKLTALTQQVLHLKNLAPFRVYQINQMLKKIEIIKNNLQTNPNQDIFNKIGLIETDINKLSQEIQRTAPDKLPKKPVPAPASDDQQNNTPHARKGK